MKNANSISWKFIKYSVNIYIYSSTYIKLTWYNHIMKSDQENGAACSNNANCDACVVCTYNIGLLVCIIFNSRNWNLYM
jgi:hypothetical protein